LLEEMAGMGQNPPAAMEYAPKLKLFLLALGFVLPFSVDAEEKEKEKGNTGKKPALKLENPGMEEGGVIPVGWHGKFGSSVVTRDTSVFRSGKASLSVDRTLQEDQKNASAHQMIPVTAGVKLKVSGWVRVEGEAKARFMAQFFDDRFTTNEGYPVKMLESPQDWAYGETELTVPEHATRMALALYVEGKGRGWLDDVKLRSDDAKIAVAKASPGPKTNTVDEPAEASQIPVTARPGYFPEHPRAWSAFHESQVRRAKEGGIEVVFLGDSLTQNWTTTGREAWTKHFEPLKAVAFGIGGDKTGNLLWRLDQGLLGKTAPKVVVLMAGVNNVWSGKNSSVEIVEGLRAVVKKIRTKTPSSKVLVLGVLPVGERLTDVARQRVTELNVLAAGLQDGDNGVKFADFSRKFIRRDGGLMDSLYLPDNLHLTAKGYETLAKELVPVVLELVKAVDDAAAKVAEAKAAAEAEAKAKAEAESKAKAEAKADSDAEADAEVPGTPDASPGPAAE
jgi:lysophospholipase L1-like esterase